VNKQALHSLACISVVKAKPNGSVMTRFAVSSETPPKREKSGKSKRMLNGCHRSAPGIEGGNQEPPVGTKDAATGPTNEMVKNTIRKAGS
jgi:hypothetical protein